MEMQEVGRSLGSGYFFVEMVQSTPTAPPEREPFDDRQLPLVLPPCVTFRRVVVSLRGPGQSPRSSLRVLRRVTAF